MCTGDQFVRKNPIHVMMVGAQFIKSSFSLPPKRAFIGGSYWLTPLDVPRGVSDYKFSFPVQARGPCVDHWPSKMF